MKKATTSVDKYTKEKTQAIIAKASEKNQADVVKGLASLRLSINGALDAVSNQLSTEIANLKEVQTAIEAKKTELQELHNIYAEANTLETLKIKHEEMEQKFAADLSEKLIQRSREEEAYNYQLGITRREEDAAWKEQYSQREEDFNSRMETIKKDLDNRYQVLQAAQTELTTLRAQVAAHEESTKKQVAAAVAIATNSLKKDLEYGFALDRKDLEHKNAVLESQMKDVTSKNELLEKTNKDLDLKYKEATERVQQIAQKAIESAGKIIVHAPQPDGTSQAVGRR